MPDEQQSTFVPPPRWSASRIALLALAAVAIIINIVLFYQGVRAKQAMAYACGYTAGIEAALATSKVPLAANPDSDACSRQRRTAHDYGFKR